MDVLKSSIGKKAIAWYAVAAAKREQSCLGEELTTNPIKERSRTLDCICEMFPALATVFKERTTTREDTSGNMLSRAPFVYEWTSC